MTVRLMAEAVIHFVLIVPQHRASLHAFSSLLRRYIILSTITLCFGFAIAESFSKKPKVMPTQAQRTRHNIQLEVEAGMEERLEALKSKIRRVEWVTY